MIESRDIKFRFWDKEDSTMNECSMINLPNRTIPDDKDPNGIIAMQFTGLKDNTGKDIYEGDILKFDPDELGNDDGIFTVEWNGTDGCRDTGGGNNSECASFKTVIGHIFES